MSEAWAYCDTCGRWFYPESDGRPTRTPPCPVCSTESTTRSEEPAAG